MKKQPIIPSLSDIPVPDSSTIEWQVLSDIMAENGTMATVSDIVDESHFTSDLRKAVWNECVRRFNEGQPFDMPNVAVAVGPEFVQHIYRTDSGIDELGFRYAEEHARALHTAIVRRRCYHAALSILNLSQEQGTTDASIYAGAAEAVAQLEPTKVRGEIALVDAINELADEIQKRTDDASSGRPNRITTGIRSIDDVLYGGMAPGQLIILSARPSVGKTALALHMLKASAAQGRSAAMFSIEMTYDELTMRLIASVSEEYEDENYGGLDKPRRSIVTPYKIANGFDSQDDWDRFEQAAAQLDKLPIVINDNARDLRDIVSRMTVLNKQGRCDVAYIDYLGLIKQAAADPRAPLYQQIADITGTLKATAKSLRIPIVLLCQLNREAAKQNKAPQLYNLRDSGSIEQDADVVLMLNQTAGPRLPDLEVWVRKNRQGEKDFGVLMRPSDNYMDFKEVLVIQNK
jgi:replicative DNA helicase